MRAFFLTRAENCLQKIPQPILRLSYSFSLNSSSEKPRETCCSTERATCVRAPKACRRRCCVVGVKWCGVCSLLRRVVESKWKYALTRVGGGGRRRAAGESLSAFLIVEPSAERMCLRTYVLPTSRSKLWTSFWALAPPKCGAWTVFGNIVEIPGDSYTNTTELHRFSSPLLWCSLTNVSAVGRGEIIICTARKVTSNNVQSVVDSRGDFGKVSITMFLLASFFSRYLTTAK